MSALLAPLVQIEPYTTFLFLAGSYYLVEFVEDGIKEVVQLEELESENGGSVSAFDLTAGKRVMAPYGRMMYPATVLKHSGM